MKVTINVTPLRYVTLRFTQASRPGACLFFFLVLGFCLGCALPLHVGWRIRAAGAQGDHVVDNVARAGALVVMLIWLG